MKYLIDTCIWIEWLTDGKLAKEALPYLKNLEQIVTPTIIQFELCRWICREHDVEAAMNVIAVTEQCNIISLDTHLALYAADLANEHKLAMADAVVYATAKYSKAQLVTCDKHFAGLKEVIYFNKEKANLPKLLRPKL
jgi:predicted nucleic acid-binding protein